MSWLTGRSALPPDPRLDAAVARNLAAQQLVAETASQAEQEAEEHRESVEAAIKGVKHRTAQRLARKGFGRSMADAALEQIEARLRRELEDPHDP